MADRVKAWIAQLDAWSFGHRSTRIARRAAAGFLQHGSLQYAGSMAYFGVLSIFQLLLLGVVAFSFFLGDARARAFVLQQVQAGLRAIYLSGWQVAGDANLAVFDSTVLTEPTPHLAALLRTKFGAKPGVSVYEGTVEDITARAPRTKPTARPPMNIARFRMWHLLSPDCFCEVTSPVQQALLLRRDGKPPSARLRVNRNPAACATLDRDAGCAAPLVSADPA